MLADSHDKLAVSQEAYREQTDKITESVCGEILQFLTK